MKWTFGNPHPYDGLKLFRVGPLLPFRYVWWRLRAPGRVVGVAWVRGRRSVLVAYRHGSVDWYDQLMVDPDERRRAERVGRALATEDRH